MLEHISRSEKLQERIQEFLDDPNKSSMDDLIMYSSEVRRLGKLFPTVTIEKVSIFKGSLYNCTATKK